MAYVGYEGYDTVVEDNQIYLKAKAEYDANVEQYEKDTKAREKQIKQKAKAEAELQQAKIEETQKYEETFANETKIYEKKIEEEQKAFKASVDSYIADTKKQSDDTYNQQMEAYTKQQDYITTFSKKSSVSDSEWNEFLSDRPVVAHEGAGSGRRPANRKSSTDISVKKHIAEGTAPPEFVTNQRGRQESSNVYTVFKQQVVSDIKAEKAKSTIADAKAYGFEFSPYKHGKDSGRMFGDPEKYGIKNRASPTKGSRFTQRSLAYAFAQQDVMRGDISISQYQSRIAGADAKFEKQHAQWYSGVVKTARTNLHNKIMPDEKKKWDSVAKTYSDARATQDKKDATTKQNQQFLDKQKLNINVSKLNESGVSSMYNTFPLTDSSWKVKAPVKKEFPSSYNSQGDNVITSPQIDSKSYIVDQPKKGNQKVQAENMKQKVYTTELRKGNVGLATALLQPQTTQKYFGKDTRNLKTYLTSMGYDINNPDSIPDSVLMNPTKYTEARAGKTNSDGKFFAPKAPVLSTEVSQKRATARAKWEGVIIPDAPVEPVFGKPKQKVSKVSVAGTADLPSWTFNGEKFTDKSKLDAYVATRKQQAQINSDKKILNYIPNKTGKLNPSGYIAPVLNKPIKSATPTIAPSKTDSTNIPSGYSGDIFSVTNPLTGVTKQFRKESRAQEHLAFVNKELEKDWDKKNPLPPKPQWVVMSDEKVNIPKMGGGTTELTAEKENVFDSLAEAESFDKAQKQSKTLGDYDNYSLANYAHSVRSGTLPEPTAWQGQTALKFSQGFEFFSNTGKSINNSLGGEHMAYTETAEEMLFTGTIDDVKSGTPQNLTGLRSAIGEVVKDPSRFAVQTPAMLVAYTGGGKIISELGKRVAPVIGKHITPIFTKTSNKITQGGYTFVQSPTIPSVVKIPVEMTMVTAKAVKTSAVKFDKKFARYEGVRVGYGGKIYYELNPLGRKFAGEARTRSIEINPVISNKPQMSTALKKSVNKSQIEKAYRDFPLQKPEPVIDVISKNVIGIPSKTGDEYILHVKGKGDLGNEAVTLGSGITRKPNFSNTPRPTVSSINNKNNIVNRYFTKINREAERRIGQKLDAEVKIKTFSPKNILTDNVTKRKDSFSDNYLQRFVENRTDDIWGMTKQNIFKRQMVKAQKKIDNFGDNISYQKNISGNFKGTTFRYYEKGKPSITIPFSYGIGAGMRKIKTGIVTRASEKLNRPVTQKVLYGTRTESSSGKISIISGGEGNVVKGIPIKKNIEQKPYITHRTTKEIDKTYWRGDTKPEFEQEVGSLWKANTKDNEKITTVGEMWKIPMKDYNPKNIQSIKESGYYQVVEKGKLIKKTPEPIVLKSGEGGLGTIPEGFIKEGIFKWKSMKFSAVKLAEKTERKTVDDTFIPTGKVKSGINNKKQIESESSGSKKFENKGKSSRTTLEETSKTKSSMEDVAKEYSKTGKFGVNPYKSYSLGGIVTGEVIIPLHKNAPRIGEGSKLDTGLGTETGIQGRIDTGADIKSDTASMLKNETESLIKQDTPQKYRTSADSGFKLDSSMSLMTAQAPVPIMIKPQITLSKTKRPAGVVIPWGQNQTQTQRKTRKRGKKAGFIGNVRADSIVGVYKRSDITYGKKRVSKLERQDKSLSKKSKTRIDGDMTLFKTKRKKTKKTESLLGHTFKKSKDEFSLGKQKGSKGKRVKASLF